ncbi:hypothetical protein GCM10009131_02540 [Morganella psychrotolerans]
MCGEVYVNYLCAFLLSFVLTVAQDKKIAGKRIYKTTTNKNSTPECAVKKD